MTIQLKKQATEALQEWEENHGGPIRNRAFAGAWKKGWEAGYLYLPKKAPYYEGTETVGAGREVPTWGRAFANYWYDGYQKGREDAGFRYDQYMEERNGQK